jgi:hypothetical protein
MGEGDSAAVVAFVTSDRADLLQKLAADASVHTPERVTEATLLRKLVEFGWALYASRSDAEQRSLTGGEFLNLLRTVTAEMKPQLASGD